MSFLFIVLVPVQIRASGNGSPTLNALFPVGIVVANIDSSSPSASEPQAPVELHTPFVFHPSLTQQLPAESLNPIQSDIRDLTTLYQRLQKNFEYAADNKSREEIDQILKKDQVHLSDSVGKGVVREVDGKIFYRMVHEGSGRSYVLFDSNDLDRESPAFKKMVGRQLLDAGPTNSAGRKLGRDTIVLARNPETNTIEEVFPYDRPAAGTKEWWGHWRNAIRGNGSRLDNVLFIGIPATVGQISLIFLWGWIGHHSMETRLINSALAFTFSMTISTFVDVYRNFINLGSDPNNPGALPRILKHSLISFGFAYPATIAHQGLSSLWYAFTHANIVLNSFLHNVARGSWRLISNAQSELRTNSGSYELTLFGRPFKLAKASALEQLILEPIMFNFKYIGLVGIGLAIPFINIDAGTLSLLLSIPLAQSIASWNIRRMINKIPPEERLPVHWEQLKRLDAQTHRLWRMPITLPGNIVRFLKNFATEFTQFYVPLWFRAIGAASAEGVNQCKRRVAWIAGKRID